MEAPSRCKVCGRSVEAVVLSTDVSSGLTLCAVCQTEAARENLERTQTGAPPPDDAYREILCVPQEVGSSPW